MKITNETLDGALRTLADEWDATRRGENPQYDNTLWWLNQTSYLGERFGTALIDDLLEARGLPSRKEHHAGTI